jgi:two-component system sensor histidine kinase VicK
MFLEFEQIERLKHREVGGTGLGLTISKKIIEQHRGRICVESEYGKGTTFYFILPIMERRKKPRRDSVNQYS